MDTRALAALLSSLISELLLLLFVIFPSSNPLTVTDSYSNSHEIIFPQIIHFLSTSEIATSLSLLSLSKKRKRAHHAEAEAEAEPYAMDEEENDDPCSQRGRVNSVIPRHPDSFKLCFKMTSSTFEWLSTLLEPLLECRDPVNSPLNLSAETRLGIGLFRLATGSDYPEISRRFGVSDSVTKFCVKQLCRVLCTNFRFWVGFPSPNELEILAKSFETLTGLPNCCGVVDCTRFKIIKNNGRQSQSIQEESIAVQIAVDSSSRILSIVAGINGNKSDSHVLKSSTLYKDIEAKNLLNSRPMDINGVSIPPYLIADGGYPLLPWLHVPFVQPVAKSSEENFNAALNLMRLPALRTIASLKNWGVLSRPIRVEFKNVVAYIGACSILHNALLMREDYSALSDGLDDYSFYDESSQYYRNASLEENSIEKKASEIRNALATRARNLS